MNNQKTFVLLLPKIKMLQHFCELMILTHVRNNIESYFICVNLFNKISYDTVFVDEKYSINNHYN